MRLFKIKYVFCLIFLWAAGSSEAQSVGNYTVARTTGNTYSSIELTGNSFAAWRYTGAFSEDDNRTVATDIGFDFWYNGTRYTQFSASTNGFIDFSSSTDDGGPQCDDYGYCNFRYSDSNVNSGTWLALAPFYDDMTTAGGVDPLGTSMKYQLSGTAPNRVLTVEWIGMAVYQNTSPDVNFQVKIYESTGVIEYWYGTMNSGTNTFSYTIGINAASISGTPTVAELLTQQTANSNNFNNSPQNNLSTMPEANSKITLTPPTAANPTGSLSFTGITNTGMTLNWIDWASNEVGYVLYYSLDDVNYFFQSQVPANVTSAAITGLLPSTTYFWRIFAVTEGALSNSLNGNATTLAPGTVTSVQNGTWNDVNTWDCICIPSAADNVIVDHNIDLINGDGIANDITINSSASNNKRIRFNGATARTLVANGDVSINGSGVNTGARIIVAGGSNVTHSFFIGGNLRNDNILNLDKDPDSYVEVFFTKKNGNQSITGTSFRTDFYTINIDKGLKSNSVYITADNFTLNEDGLFFNSGGTVVFNTPDAFNAEAFSTLKEIPANCKILMNSSGSTLSFADGLNLLGDLELIDGTINIGDAADENLTFNGGNLVISGGSINVAGRIDRTTTESVVRLTQSGGTLTLPTAGSTSTTLAPFMMDVSGSVFNVSGGVLAIQREGGSGASNLGIDTRGATFSSVTGGTLQIGDASTPAAQEINLTLGTEVFDLTVNSANVTATLTDDITVLNNVNLVAGSFNDNGATVDISGDWLVSGGTTIPSIGGIVSFTGADQAITSSGTTFSNLDFVGTGVKTIQDDLFIAGDLTLSSNLALASSNLNITIGGDWINNGAFNESTGTVIFNGTTDQAVSGSSVTRFFNFTTDKPGSIFNIEGSLEFIGAWEIPQATTVNFNGVGGTGKLTLISNEVGTGRVGIIPAGTVFNGSATFQRTVPNGSGGRFWRYFAPPFDAVPVAQLKQYIPVTGVFNDPSIQAEWPEIPGIVENSPSMYIYDETLVTTDRSEGWVAWPAAGTNAADVNLVRAQGAAIFVRQQDAALIEFTGTVTGIQAPTAAVTSSGPSGANDPYGWNLIANPYASPIQWDNVTKPAGVNDEIHFLDNANAAGLGFGAYIRYVGGVGTPASYTGEIALGQAFWVRATANATITFKQADKSTGGTFFIRDQEPDDLLRIRVNYLDGAGADEAVIRFWPEATDDFDRKFDANQLKTSNVAISSLLNNEKKISINTLSNDFCSREVRLSLNGVNFGKHEINFFNLESFNDNMDITLFDAYTETVVNVRANPLYSFAVSEDPASYGDNRFKLVFDKVINPYINVQYSDELCRGERGSISLEKQPGVNYFLTMSGEVVSDTLKATSGNNILIFNSNDWFEGANTLMLNAFRDDCNLSKIITSIDIYLGEVPPAPVPIDGQTCLMEEVRLEVLPTVDSVAGYNWYNTYEAIDPLVTTSIPEFITEPLSVSGVYWVSQINQHGCESERVMVIAEVVQLETPEITFVNNHLQSSALEGNQWLRDGELIPGATNQTYDATVDGNYTVQVIEGGCVVMSVPYEYLVSSLAVEVANMFSIYPNPARDVLELRPGTDFQSNEEHKLVIINTDGRIVLSQQYRPESDQRINVAPLPDGLYILKIITSRFSLEHKFIKED